MKKALLTVVVCAMFGGGMILAQTKSETATKSAPKVAPATLPPPEPPLSSTKAKSPRA